MALFDGCCRCSGCKLAPRARRRVNSCRRRTSILVLVVVVGALGSLNDLIGTLSQMQLSAAAKYRAYGDTECRNLRFAPKAHDPLHRRTRRRVRFAFRYDQQPGYLSQALRDIGVFHHGYPTCRRPDDRKPIVRLHAAPFYPGRPDFDGLKGDEFKRLERPELQSLDERSADSGRGMPSQP